ALVSDIAHPFSRERSMENKIRDDLPARPPFWIGRLPGCRARARRGPESSVLDRHAPHPEVLPLTVVLCDQRVERHLREVLAREMSDLHPVLAIGLPVLERPVRIGVLPGT